MDAAAYARFLEALGHRVVRIEGTHWYDVGPRFFMSAPPSFLYTPSADALKALFRQTGCVGVRYATPLDAPGRLSYQIVCDNRSYGFDCLSANNRSKVRRGIKRCRIEAVPLSTIASHGRRAHADTVGRQGRDSVLDGERWDSFFRVAGETEGFEGWAAWVDDELAAFLVSVVFEDSVEFMLARSRSDMLNAYPNNALVFQVAEEMLVRRGLRQITFGLESLEPVGPLDQFKFGMGFTQQPLRQRVVFHPILRAALRLGAVRAPLAWWAERRGEQDVFWRKAAGLLRFAAEGEQ